MFTMIPLSKSIDSISPILLLVVFFLAVILVVVLSVLLLRLSDSAGIITVFSFTTQQSI